MSTNSPKGAKAVEQIFSAFQADNPEPVGELDYVNEFTLLVAVVLSAQATDVSVNKATSSLFKIADSPEKMVQLGVKEIENHIKTIGLYRTKAKNTYGLSKLLIENHNSIVPNTRQQLEALPGVGRKTANVVLNIAFGQPTIAVDTHLFRLGNRTGLAKGKTPRAVEDKLRKIIPKAYLRHAHHWLILHGRYICKARKPACDQCLIQTWCAFDEKNLEPTKGS